MIGVCVSVFCEWLEASVGSVRFGLLERSVRSLGRFDRACALARLSPQSRHKVAGGGGGCWEVNATNGLCSMQPALFTKFSHATNNLIMQYTTN